MDSDFQFSNIFIKDAELIIRFKHPILVFLEPKYLIQRHRVKLDLKAERNWDLVVRKFRSLRKIKK